MVRPFSLQLSFLNTKRTPIKRRKQIKLLYLNTSTSSTLIVQLYTQSVDRKEVKHQSLVMKLGIIDGYAQYLTRDRWPHCELSGTDCNLMHCWESGHARGMKGAFEHLCSNKKM